MKLKATKKEMKDCYYRIISIGYCDAEYLLRFENEIAYSSGVYGWACDYYDVNGVLISTGYAPLTEKNSKRDFALVQKYNDAAREIVSDYKIPYEDQKEQVKALLNEFIVESTK